MESVFENKPGNKKRLYISPKSQNKIKMFLCVLPLLVVVLIFSYAPLFGWIYAFTDYTLGKRISDLHFVGFKYFIMAFNGVGDMGTVLRNTLVLSFFGILTMPVAMIFAIMLSQMQTKSLSKFIQTVTSLPNFISWILVYSIFFIFFSAEDGAVNKVLLGLGLISTPTNILGDSDAAWLVQVLISLWKNTGWNAIIYIAAMAGIDQELYSAADVDGAGSFQKILHVTIPGLMPTFFVLLLLGIANILNVGFEQYYVFQNALVLNKLEVLDTYIYKIGLGGMQFSFSTAMGILKSFVSIILLTVANILSKTVRGESIF